MKKLFFLTLFSVVISFSLSAQKLVKKGNTQSALGTYVIEKTNDFVEIDGKALPTYVITYQNSKQKIRVAVDRCKKGKIKNYIVLGDNLNLQYVCDIMHFGVKQLDSKYIKAGIKSINDKLDVSAYYHQKVLTRAHPVDRDCLGLIACYYPMLITDYETAFACKK